MFQWHKNDVNNSGDGCRQEGWKCRSIKQRNAVLKVDSLSHTTVINETPVNWRNLQFTAEKQLKFWRCLDFSTIFLFRQTSLVSFAFSETKVPVGKMEINTLENLIRIGGTSGGIGNVPTLADIDKDHQPDTGDFYGCQVTTLRLHFALPPSCCPCVASVPVFMWDSGTVQCCIAGFCSSVRSIIIRMPKSTFTLVYCDRACMQ